LGCEAVDVLSGEESEGVEGVFLIIFSLALKEERRSFSCSEGVMPPKSFWGTASHHGPDYEVKEDRTKKYLRILGQKKEDTLRGINVARGCQWYVGVRERASIKIKYDVCLEKNFLSREKESAGGEEGGG